MDQVLKMMGSEDGFKIADNIDKYVWCHSRSNKEKLDISIRVGEFVKLKIGRGGAIRKLGICQSAKGKRITHTSEDPDGGVVEVSP